MKIFTTFPVSGTFALDAEQSRHILKSLRMKKGDVLTVCDGTGKEYGCIIEDTAGGIASLKVCYTQASKSEPSVKVGIYQGLPKGQKLEDVIQKCTELGAYEFVPMITARSVSRPNEKQAKTKVLRYGKIALESAQQSGRGIIPNVSEIIPFEKAVERCEADVKILFYEGGGNPLKKIMSENQNALSYAVFIGPEGGFEKSEVETLQKAGAKTATLGPRILRTQTAPVAALAAIMLLSGNLE